MMLKSKLRQSENLLQLAVSGTHRRFSAKNWNPCGNCVSGSTVHRLLCACYLLRRNEDAVECVQKSDEIITPNYSKVGMEMMDAQGGTGEGIMELESGMRKLATYGWACISFPCDSFLSGVSHSGRGRVVGSRLPLLQANTHTPHGTPISPKQTQAEAFKVSALRKSIRVGLGL
ncbi:hypothetical protein JZ751_001854 [Albula glossodonta]|uniref:Uncharacterized protein n=1 Tax=Albula glossodonta TaxID=121402 RepID=A0A8T2PUZ5_9TELE|nr:hypothetical protein JZ751_001854 [Albula glossodonta]